MCFEREASPAKSLPDKNIVYLQDEEVELDDVK